MTTIWIDHGVTPPVPVPTEVDAALAYLGHVLGHPCYERWTLSRMKRSFVSLGEAKKIKPTAFGLLLDHPEAVEWWERGRLRTAAIEDAPDPSKVLTALLHTHRRRFRPTDGIMPARSETVGDAGTWIARIESKQTAELMRWLARGGRFVNQQPGTNTLAVVEDLDALASFLRERASKSRHTLRAYASEMRRLVTWCRDRQLGPLSDLTRGDLLQYHRHLAQAHVTTDMAGSPTVKLPAPTTVSRAMATVASLYEYWHETGYLIANPAAKLVNGSQKRTGYSPQRFLPPALVTACDAWALTTVEKSEDITLLRRRAIWALYRFSGVRLAELAWSQDTGLPRIEAEASDRWTLHVHGKGDKLRSIPLPMACVRQLRAYRIARGLPGEPGAAESVPLIHGFKGGSLQESGLFDQVKSLFCEVAKQIEHQDPGQAALLRAASPHWLRHTYAKSLVVDHKVPLPAAQMLLGHASVETTAAYAKTDLSQLREFVDESFTVDE
ncbi:tyrosine-type recombinase/integrase [Herbaspirillum huttiense]|uniref:Tyrosine-type recombinase/integrase n=2 Tax=Herbaspirillum huttiense TaxID=863372 RepID=A0AAJ2HCX8_9BURK|nr:tyrosine-type recombinase/integrase [Herbaspirillum huttiense]MDR9839753.1 tyrosine-type recombinase/integrase [Herbaspirillum huttiense]